MQYIFELKAENYTWRALVIAGPEPKRLKMMSRRARTNIYRYETSLSSSLVSPWRPVPLATWNLFSVFRNRDEYWVNITNSPRSSSSYTHLIAFLRRLCAIRQTVHKTSESNDVEQEPLCVTGSSDAFGIEEYIFRQGFVDDIACNRKKNSEFIPRGLRG